MSVLIAVQEYSTKQEAELQKSRQYKMNLDKETERKIQELQLFEQQLQNILMQKQAFQMELSETENALGEIKKTNSDVFKMIGQIMIKTSKEELEKSLKQKKELLSIRLKAVEKQESPLREQSEKIHKEVMKKINPS